MERLSGSSGMFEDLQLNRLVWNVLSEKHYSHCRLCLKEIQDEYVRFEDCVSMDSRSGSFKELSEILFDIFGPEICDNVVSLDAACMDCVDKALEAQKFLQNCRKSMKLLKNVLDNLTNTLDIGVTNAGPEHSLYILISEHDPKLKLVDKKKNKNKSESITSVGYSCLICSQECVDAIGLKVHNLACHGVLTCEKCYHTTNDEKELNDHLNSEQMFHCAECNFNRCTEESLIQHNDRYHGVYVCKNCGKSYRDFEKLQVHEQKHMLKNECPKCGKCYNTKEFFLKHVKLCLEDMLEPHPMRSKIKKTYFCDKCGKGYSTPGGLRVHDRFVHGDAKPHVCNICNKNFTAPSYLKVHMIKHTGEKNFKCDICTRKFVSKEALLYHTRRHTGEKPYNCTMCEEKFVNSSARAEHIKFKHVGPTLTCEICSRRFVTPTFLRQHMKKHHDPSNKLYAGRNMIPANLPSVENMRVRFID